MTDRTDGKSAGDGTTRFIDARRRGFLQGAVIAGGAAASGAALAHHDGTGEHAEAIDAAAAPAGYRESDHVREYYAKARF